jgi:hypothetical protein
MSATAQAQVFVVELSPDYPSRNAVVSGSFSAVTFFQRSPIFLPSLIVSLTASFYTYCSILHDMCVMG